MTSDLPRPCPKCGAATEVFHQDSAGGTRCTRCDWGVVATCLPAILNDFTRYDLVLTGGDPRDEGQLRAVAQVANINLLQARNMLRHPPETPLFTGIASEVAGARDRLAGAGIAFAITPPFPW